VVMLTGTGAKAQHQASLSWIAPTNSLVPVTGYNVYREMSGGSSFQLLDSSPVTQTSYVDQNVVSGSSYTYYVTSVASDGTESTDSSQVSATIP
jgi:fibronectin type 3 domain-containing protein